MINAGCDPDAAIGLWQRMQQIGGQQTPEFASTHPSHESRIAHLHEIMSRAKQEYVNTEKTGR